MVAWLFRRGTEQEPWLPTVQSPLSVKFRHLTGPEGKTITATMSSELKKASGTSRPMCIQTRLVDFADMHWAALKHEPNEAKARTR